MGRLLRVLLDALARGLRAVAGRLAPSPTPAVAVVEEPAAVDPADGPPSHWLAMVRTRAPGLHVSMQERGVVARRVAPVARPLPGEPPPSIARAARPGDKAGLALALAPRTTGPFSCG